MIISIDQSKRSTAAMAFDSRTGLLIDFILITPPKDIDQEHLINYQWNYLQNFIDATGYKLKAVALEGAAFAAVGASNDLLWGIQWYIRTRFLVEYEVPVGILTAATWRSTLVPIKEQRAFKAQYGGKIGLKHAVVSKLPEDVKKRFDDYLELNKDRINTAKGFPSGSRSNEYKKSLWDLSDAWGVGKHRLTLLPKTLKLQRRTT